MRKFRPFSLFPRFIYPIYAGYSGLNGGIGFVWLGKMIYLIKPINERKNLIAVERGVIHTQTKGCKLCLHIGATAVYMGKRRKDGKQGVYLKI
jgi:hypothetical protein